MGILEHWRELRTTSRSSNAQFGWTRVIGGLAIVTIPFGVLFLWSAIVGGKDASTGALITVILVAITAGAIAYFGLLALGDRLPPATYQRVGLVAFWAFILTIVGFVALAFR